MKTSHEEFFSFEKCKQIFRLPEKEFSEAEIIQLRNQLLTPYDVYILECKSESAMVLDASKRIIKKDIFCGLENPIIDEKYLNETKNILRKLLDENTDVRDRCV